MAAAPLVSLTASIVAAARDGKTGTAQRRYRVSALGNVLKAVGRGRGSQVVMAHMHQVPWVYVKRTSSSAAVTSGKVV